MPKSKQPSYKGLSFFRVPYTDSNKKKGHFHVKSKCSRQKNKICNAAYVAYGLEPKNPKKYKRGPILKSGSLKPLTYMTAD